MTTRRDMAALLGRSAAFGLVLALGAAAGGSAQETTGQAEYWVQPAYPTAPAEDKVLTMVNVYNYVEQRFDPPLRLETGVASEVYSLATPEAAAISRLSAMMAGDHATVEGMWDEASRALTQARDAEMGRTPETYQSLWGALFEVSRPTLVHRIESGDYVILTYMYVMGDGTPLEDLEFPMILRKVGDEWRTTQELARDELPELSPWVTGETEVERVVE